MTAEAQFTTASLVQLHSERALVLLHLLPMTIKYEAVAAVHFRRGVLIDE